MQIGLIHIARFDWQRSFRLTAVEAVATMLGLISTTHGKWEYIVDALTHG
jgi:hypothetical protein